MFIISPRKPWGHHRYRAAERSIHHLTATEEMPMTWIRAHDRVLVLGAALFLVASALLIMRGVLQFGENFGAASISTTQNRIAPAQSVEMEQAIEGFANRRNGRLAAAPASSFPKNILSTPMVSPQLCKPPKSIRPCLTNGSRNSACPSPMEMF
jgi:hypothetical protein